MERKDVAALIGEAEDRPASAETQDAPRRAMIVW